MAAGGWPSRSRGSASTIPDTVQILIGQQIENLAAEERRVLQIAAVSGAEFSAAAIAATPGLDVQAVEEICDRLVQREQFITSRGSHDWPDGTVANRYAFVHAMYQEGLGSRVSEARRVEWQGRIAAREEQAYGANARDIAAQLAVRFEAARQYDRSVKYFELAARNALAGNAYIEAARLYGKAIDMLPLGPARRSRQGRAAHAAAAQRRRHRGAGIRDRRDREDPQRALTLAARRGDQPAVVRVLHSVWTTCVAQGQLHKARSLAIEISDQAELTSDKTALLQAHAKLGQTASISASSPWRAPISRMRWRSRPTCRTRNGRASRATSPGPCGIWASPMPPAAWARRRCSWAARSRATMAWCLPRASPAWVHAFRGELAEAEALVDRAVRDVLGVWPAVLDHLELLPEGPDPEQARRLRGGPGAHAAIGGRLSRDGRADRPGALHDRAGRDGDWRRATTGLGLATIEEAREICAKTGNRYHAADTHRVQGELLIAANRAEEGELRLLHSLNVARSHGARSLELRTLISLAKRSPDWLIQLKATRDGFTEGLDTLDLRRADEVLARA